MEEADIKPLLDAKDRLLSAVPTGIRRYLAKDIDWRDRLICIKGPKGALQRAELLAVLDSREAKLKQFSKPEKIFLGDSNLMHALVAYPDIGAIRETVFMNQLRAAGHKLTAPDNGDFVVDGKWLFEIGGPGKTFRQIAGERDGFVVNDGVETGIGNKIPLWLFGFLY